MLTADSPLRARAVAAPVPGFVALVRPLIVSMLMTAALIPRLAALAAGGTLVSDRHAPAWWTLADAQGNKVDLATWQGRD